MTTPAKQLAKMGIFTMEDALEEITKLRADKERLDWMEKKLAGASDSERYLPFRIYWGHTKDIRAAIDKVRVNP